MTSDRHLRWCVRSYSRLLSLLLRVREREERDAICADGEQMLGVARDRGLPTLARTWLALVGDLLLTGARHDARQALRALVRSPGITIGTSLLLAAGVATTTTLFAFVDAALLRPLPYDEPDRLVIMYESNVAEGRLREGASPGNVVDWVAAHDVFDAISASMRISATLRHHEEGGIAVTGSHVTRGFFDVYRRSPVLGRTFRADEYEGATSITSRQPSRGEPIVVLSHRLWRTLGADPQIVDSRVSIEGREWRVIGVMPDDFAVPDATAAFWAPWDIRTSYRGARFPEGPPRDARFLRVSGRMKAGLSIHAAGARMETLAGNIAARHPRTNAGWTVRLTPLGEDIARTSRLELQLVFGAMACLLVLVCVNVGSLAVARSVARAREMAIRLALGATPIRVTRQVVAENALSAVVTAVIAVLLSFWWIDAAVSIAPTSIPRLHEVAMNARIASFAVMLAATVTIVTHALPALRAGRTDITSSLKDGVALSSRAAGRLRAFLVMAEIAAAVMLLIGAGLLARTFLELHRVDLGFDRSNLLVLRVTPDAARYRTDSQALDYYRRLMDAVREVPGVASVAAVTALPMSTIGSDFTRPYWPERAEARHEGSPASQAGIRMASPGYFATLGVPLLTGREFADRDDADAPRVVIVNQTLARDAWGSEDPVGRRLILDYQGGAYPYEVVGVVQDARGDGPRSAAEPEIFIPHAQNAYLVMNVIARTMVDPGAIAQTVRAHARQADPDQPVHSVTTMEQLLADVVQLDRFAMLLVALFAVGGLVTAAAGVYALLAYAVVQRRREIALRMALGASPWRVARSIVGESLALASAGCAIGVAAATACARYLGSLLFGVAPQDPPTIFAAVVILVLVAVAASWLPARRAASIDPRI